MLIIIDPHNGVPIYRQVVDQIRFHILAGRIAPGDELPSTRSLSLRLGVNPMTISKAYGILEDEGIVTRRPGLPLVVRDRAPEKRTSAKKDQLAAVLHPAALAAVQLGIRGKEAGALLRALVDERHRTLEKPE